MKKTRKAIRQGAYNHYNTLCQVQPNLDSILFSRIKRGNCIPFGSFVNGTYTGHSDIDVHIQNNSKQWGSADSRALNLVKHLQNNHGIEARATGRIVFFTYQGVQINAVAATPTQIAAAKERDQKILNWTNSHPMYLEVVRFFKLFASTYIERFPNGTASRPIYPGSHFYSVVAAIAMDIVNNTKKQLNYTYPEAIKVVASFIGEDEYMKHLDKMKQFEVDPYVKFNSVAARGDFNKCFRALVAHLEREIPLPGMNVHSMPKKKLTQSLLALTLTEELLREQKQKGEKKKQPAKKKKQLVSTFARMMINNSTYDDTDSDDSDHDPYYVYGGQDYYEGHKVDRNEYEIYDSDYEGGSYYGGYGGYGGYRSCSDYGYYNDEREIEDW